MKPIKKSVAFVIYSPDRSKFLVVQRATEDESLPNIWGLPAASLKEKESYEEAVKRGGKEKLGIELQVGRLVNEGSLEREHFTLHMKEFEAKIMEGEPKVPQSLAGVSQYQKWEWASADKLKEAAQKGSLCSRLFLTSKGLHW